MVGFGTARFLVLKSKIKKSVKFGSREIRQARKKVYKKNHTSEKVENCGTERKRRSNPS